MPNIKTAALLAVLLATSSAIGADLNEARSAYSTKLLRLSKSPQPYTAESPPAGVKEIRYPSGKLLLKAWISTAAKPNVKSPAVVFLHGGFSFGSDDWEAAREFVKAGYVLLMPMLRGENGNDGNFELFGGEVDDAIAAGKYLARLPGVDPSRVYVTGHSVGGSLAILVAQMNSPFKGAAALSGYARLPEWIDHSRRAAPFDTDNANERKIRDPYLYVASVKIPLYLLSESANRAIVATNSEFCAIVAKTSACRHEVVAGTHGSMIAPSVSKTIEWFGSLGK